MKGPAGGAGERKWAVRRETGNGRPWGRRVCRLCPYMNCCSIESFEGGIPLAARELNRAGGFDDCDRILTRLGWHTTVYER